MIVFGHAARAPRPRDDNSSGRAVPDSWTIGGKTLARQRFGRPRGVDGCGRLPRPAKTATSTVAAVLLAARSSRRPKTIESPASSHGLGCDDAWDPQSALPSVP